MLSLAKELIFVTVLLFGVPFVVMSVLTFSLKLNRGVDEHGRALHKPGPEWFFLLRGLFNRLVPLLATVYWFAWVIRVVVYFIHRR